MIAGPPNRPGGSEMLWTTSNVIATPSGRSSQLGEGTCAAARAIPARSTRRRVGSAANTRRLFDSEPLHAISHGRASIAETGGYSHGMPRYGHVDEGWLRVAR